MLVMLTGQTGFIKTPKYLVDYDNVGSKGILWILPDTSCKLGRYSIIPKISISLPLGKNKSKLKNRKPSIWIQAMEIVTIRAVVLNHQIEAGSFFKHGDQFRMNKGVFWEYAPDRKDAPNRTAESVREFRGWLPGPLSRTRPETFC